MSKWGFISPTGSFAQRKMLRHFKDRDTIYVSRTPGELELGRYVGSHKSVQTVALETMLDDPTVENVYICTPTRSHFLTVHSCLDAGKNVLVEKTPSTSEHRVKDLVAMAKNKGLRLDVSCQCMNYMDRRESLVRLGVHYAKSWMNLPLGGGTQLMAWDIAWYGVMLGRHLAGPLEYTARDFWKDDRIYHAGFDCPGLRYEMEFSDNARTFKQCTQYMGTRKGPNQAPGWSRPLMGATARKTNHSHHKPFTGPDEHPMYGHSITDFERKKPLMIDRVLRSMETFAWLEKECYDVDGTG